MSRARKLLVILTNDFLASQDFELLQSAVKEGLVTRGEDILSVAD